MPYLTSYLNVDEVETAIANLARAYPALCRLVELPHRTYEGRTCHALQIGSGPARPTVLAIGGVHAREWGSCEILVTFAADLLAAYTAGTGLRYGGRRFTDGDVRTIITRLGVLVFPLVNPDGRRHSQTSTTHADWRKNRNPANAGGSTDAACVGVDVNRNFDFLFDLADGFAAGSEVWGSTSPNPCEYEVYQGPAPFSEAETRNVRWLLDRHRQVRWFLDLHAYAQRVLHSWGDDESQTGDPSMSFRNPAHNGKRGVAGDSYREYLPGDDLRRARRLAGAFCDGLAAVRGTRYAAGPSFGLYPTAGASDDYAYSRNFVDPGLGRVLAFTVEWGTEFQAPWPRMAEVAGEVVAGLHAFCLEAAGQHTDGSTAVQNADYFATAAVGVDSRVRWAWWHGGWRDWQPVGTLSVPPGTPVAAVARSSDYMDLFAVAADGGLQGSAWHGEWGEWQRIGAATFAPASGVAAWARNADYMDIAAVDVDGRVRWAWWHGGWRAWEAVGTRTFAPGAPLAAVARSSDYMDLFAVAPDGGLHGSAWHGQWGEWQRIGSATFVAGSGVAAWARNADYMDIAAVDVDGRVRWAWWHGGWREWEAVGSRTFPPGTPVAGVARSSDYMDLFAVAPDGGLYGASWHGQWGDWYRLGTRTFPPGTRPVVSARGPDYFDVWAVADDGRAYWAWWHGEWHDWTPIGGGGSFPS